MVENSGLSKRHAWDLSQEEWKALLTSWQEPEFRCWQIIRALYKHGAKDFAEMSNLSKPLRQILHKNLIITPPFPYVTVNDSPEKTNKFFFYKDKKYGFESVSIEDRDRLTFCLSSQIGCAMQCAFCATGKLGLHANLPPSGIWQQIFHLAEYNDCWPTNLVFMGMGEPLQNLSAIRKVLEMLTHPEGLNWSSRKITISTCGWLPGLEEWQKNPLPAKLAVSLNATTDVLRSKLMPINRRYNLSILTNALRKVQQKTLQRITIEYVVIPNLNDTSADAVRLKNILRNLNVKVNLIPYNPIPGQPWSAPTPARVEAFKQAVKQATGLLTTIRYSKGQTIQAACGQLAGANFISSE
jgi:23S rRNA (adenine2503-C2)-methyltransferase